MSWRSDLSRQFDKGYSFLNRKATRTSNHYVHRPPIILLSESKRRLIDLPSSPFRPACFPPALKRLLSTTVGHFQTFKTWPLAPLMGQLRRSKLSGSHSRWEPRRRFDGLGYLQVERAHDSSILHRHCDDVYVGESADVIASRFRRDLNSKCVQK